VVDDTTTDDTTEDTSTTDDSTDTTVDDTTAPIEEVDLTKYVCGDELTTYATWDPAIVCLVFDKMDPPMKVVFTPHVDKFEVLQIKGLFSKFESIKNDELTMTAVSNGVISRPVKFKI
jgi:hypothetical protein